MSYSLHLKAEKGFISLASQSGDIPDGSFEISGHRDERGTYLQIARRQPDGTHVEAASHSHAVPAPAEVAPDNEEPF
jgi:hypothetical protein